MFSPNLPQYNGETQTDMHDATIQTERFPGMVKFLLPILSFYSRWFHRSHWEGAPLIGDGLTSPLPSGGLIVASNHVSGFDPVLLQVYFPRPIRWMMERQMMIPLLNSFWRGLKIIPVEESGGSAALRDAFRHLGSGGVIGIFPEGRIARPQGRIQLFHPGLAMIARRTKTPVAVFLLDGIPPCGNPFWSFFRRSRARVRLMAVVPPPILGEESAWTLRLRNQMGAALGATVDVDGEGHCEQIASG